MEKKILSEIHTMKKMMGLISEEEEQKPDYEKCISASMNFYFGKSTGTGTENEDGGILSRWSSKGNDYPEISDKKSQEKFLQLVKDDYTGDDSWIVWDDETCGDPPEWEEVLPTIKLLYFKTLMDRTREHGEEYTVEDIPELIEYYAEYFQNGFHFDTVFEYASHVITAVLTRIDKVGPGMSEEEYGRLYNKIKNEYGPKLTGVENPYR